MNSTIYTDPIGNLYKVMPHFGGHLYKGCKQPINQPNKWQRMGKLVFRNTFEEAQVDLDTYATKKDWEKVK